MRRLLGFIGRLIGLATAVAAGAGVWRLLNPGSEPADIPAAVPLFPSKQAPDKERPSTIDEPKSAAWVPAVDGACPVDYPIKAKHSSEIFHSPDGASYERTAADRCYRDAEAAEADGLRPAKR
ncbi:MAG: hypothetical protein F2894_02905 [Actinobacteria bacterium]|uniref:Unannotated protein n=1 Tax=freshwater metagenome TaxID=449393 RepID=A0A6J7MK36_9ZZZZ|nr:hypothetical protein [Actinomycetota bacterium]MSW05140.1 hypothetical protein [Actinomycetota bacterium]